MRDARFQPPVRLQLRENFFDDELLLNGSEKVGKFCGGVEKVYAIDGSLRGGVVL